MSSILQNKEQAALHSASVYLPLLHILPDFKPEATIIVEQREDKGGVGDIGSPDADEPRLTTHGRYDNFYIFDFDIKQFKCNSKNTNTLE
jgi:hypothetical protein